MKFNEISNIGFTEIDKNIEKKTKRKLKYMMEAGHSGRGNVLIGLDCIIWPDDPIYSYYKKMS